MTAVYVVLWLISSSAWADAVTKIKMYTDPNQYFFDEYACECAKTHTECVHAAQRCDVIVAGNYATINVSIVSVEYFSSVMFHCLVFKCDV